MNAEELLMQFNLTRQESSVYLTLLSEGGMNGYEISKTMGISRSNAYTCLASLVEKGCAYVIEGPAVRYIPVEPDEFCSNRIRKLQDAALSLRNAIPARQDEPEGYITIKGKSHILDKMRSMVAAARKRVYVSASKEVLDEILPELKRALADGLKVVLITNIPSALEGAVIYPADKAHRQIRLIVDSFNVLTGDVDDGEHSTCLYSKKKNLIDLIKESLKNEIKIIEMTKG